MGEEERGEWCVLRNVDGVYWAELKSVSQHLLVESTFERRVGQRMSGDRVHVGALPTGDRLLDQQRDGVLGVERRQRIGLDGCLHRPRQAQHVGGSLGARLRRQIPLTQRRPASITCTDILQIAVSLG